jgi:hypothetical protein
MKKLLFICLLLIATTMTAKANPSNLNFKKTFTSHDFNYIFLYYEIRLLNDGCFHLVSVYDGFYVINDFKTWAGKTVFGCLTEDVFVNMC